MWGAAKPKQQQSASQRLQLAHQTVPLRLKVPAMEQPKQQTFLGLDRYQTT